MSNLKFFIGIDLHLKTSQITVMDEQGNIIQKTKLYNHKELIITFFEPFPRSTSISVEATYNWPWLIDLLENMGFSPKLVHPKKVKVIAESAVKTDKIDSKVLAHLDRLNFLPLSYIPSKQDRQIREILRYRQYLIKIRTGLKNRIHSILAKLGIQHIYSDLFGKTGRDFLINLDLNSAYKKPILEQLEIISSLNERVKDIQKIVRKQIPENHSAQLISTVPALGELSSLLLAIEIGPITRFKNWRKLVNYAGLCSTVSQSDKKVKHGHINKDSNPVIRWILIQATPKAIKQDPKLKTHYYKILFKKGKTKAKVAVARKMLVAIYFMLKNNQPYKLSHNIRKKQESSAKPFITTGSPTKAALSI